MKDEKAERQHHATYLAMCVVVLVLAFVLTDHDDKVFVFGRAVPPLCPLKAWSGWDCPGCGLTRSFVALAHGEIGHAFAYHRIGLALFLLTAYQLIYRPVMIFRGGEVPHGLAAFHRWTGRLLIGALLINWVLKVFFGL